jgi:two-component system, LytTR family, response regulator AlgR
MTEPGAEPLRIVVADDEPLARRRLCDLLATTPGVAMVAECGDGRSVLDAVTAMRPDVVLLDIQMPGRDGTSVAKLLDAMEDDAPALVLVTAHTERTARGLGIVAADYLTKPFSAERLGVALERARMLLRARQGTTGSRGW